jgi:hypothetical protein
MPDRTDHATALRDAATLLAADFAVTREVNRQCDVRGLGVHCIDLYTVLRAAATALETDQGATA